MSRPPPRSTASTHSHSSTSVRRNLFNSHAHISRRPTSNNTNSTLSSSGANGGTHFDNPLHSSSAADPGSTDILVRNANGEYAVAIPGVPPPAADAAGAGEGGGGVENGGDEDEGEVERRLAELLGSRRGLQSTEQELVDAVRASLRRKVEALAEDEWVFEGESSKM
ncbi:hypothetical protein MMC10_007351 [Thelotrema lepadinum]|nr:hypothetical protein [Thelotrema lepadinum]